MEEIVGAETIQGEILDDARKKAARLLEEAEEESRRTLSAVEDRADAVVAEIMRTSQSRAERFRMETMARLPLEVTRMRTDFVDRRLREALGSYMAALGEERIASLAEAMLARGSSFFSGQAVALARKGLSEGRAASIAERRLKEAASVELEEDQSLPAPGLVARVADGSILLRATMDLVEERLLDATRGELVEALCADGLHLDAGAPREARGL
jgi:vacuolar-type H+-ATPase subunit H